MDKENIDRAYKMLEDCVVCPRNCHVNRLKGELGYCRMDADITISSFGSHFGEEEILVGKGGSGTIFLTGCSLGCIFCQNHNISHLREGREIGVDEMVNTMLILERMNCHNINFVTPTHFTPQIMKAIYLAREKGLTLPIVYNCGGYESLETLKLLEDFIDIYMPDVKYADSKTADELCAAPDYPDVIKAALREMYRQVGNLTLDESGVAKKGLLIRHLVMPNRLSGTEQIMDFIATRISPEAYINIMDQYKPMYRAAGNKDINRCITPEEYRDAINMARGKGLFRGF